jgi:hypothetical protein
MPLILQKKILEVKQVYQDLTSRIRTDLIGNKPIKKLISKLKKFE